MFHAKNAESAKFFSITYNACAGGVASFATTRERRGGRGNCLHAHAEIYGKGELEEEDGGEAVLEFKVHGLVMPYFHAEP